MSVEFQKVLEAAGLASRKEDGVYRRRKITFHSFRRFVKTTIANQTRNSDYSEWFLGHKKSSYYVNKPEELKRIYKEDCMRYLTFLNYPTLEASARSLEDSLKRVETENMELKRQVAQLQQVQNHTDASLQEQVRLMNKELENLKKLVNK